VDYKELTALAAKDAILCGHILSTVNSAGLGKSRTITSVQQALLLLGVSHLRQIALSLVVGNLFSKAKTPPSWSGQRFNLHSGATALLTQAIVDHLPIDNVDGAFVGGMLHDIGKLLIAVALPREYETIAAMVQVREQTFLECERETIGTDHAELSAFALREWGLPEPVCEAVRCHHDVETADAPKLSVILASANSFVNQLGISVLPPAVHKNPMPILEIPGFELDSSAVLQRFEAECIDLTKFFQ
jgi:putative nucleotidyltransferase with HDIG domain